ncbi:MAG TPA: glycoside hydrolase family 16 protein [Bacteroides sp.]|nr:glycoside hydrolase family 16 protein [Bacteroides sp.]
MNRCTSFICLLVSWSVAIAQTPATDPHWRLVFDEPFDSIDPAVWKVAHHFDHYGEPQVYTGRESNVSAKDGELVLRVSKERYRYKELSAGESHKRVYDYTSGWVETREDYYIRYGYLESRIRLPHGRGFWPAFWTFVGDHPDRHNAAEIDIFEMLGNQPPTVMGTNLHIGYCNCGENDCNCEYLNDRMCPEVNPDILCHQLDVKIPDYTAGYHTYAVEWSPSKIIWYVNGNMVRNSANPGIIDPVRIILNLAITPWTMPDRTTPFPSTMHVDYVKLYRLEFDTTRIETCQYDFSQSVATVKKAIFIGGDSCTNLIPPFTDVTLRATEGIEISGDFQVPLGAQLYMDVNKEE